MDDFDKLTGVLSRIQLAHQIPGRIRLKLNSPVDEKSVTHFKTTFSRLSNALDNIPGIHSIRVNMLARSCTVEYDSKSIPDHAWSDLLAGVRSQGALSLVTRLGKKYREIVGEPS